MYIQIIAEHLSDQDIAGLREMFKAMDNNNRGLITLGELKRLGTCGFVFNNTDISYLMEVVSRYYMNEVPTIIYGLYFLKVVISPFCYR
jgi:Ca2+-binding EF-hand superfamily protein